jgi:hypothetical protein
MRVKYPPFPPIQLHPQHASHAGTSITINTTIINAREMNGFLPTPQYEFEPEWRWPWWKFELPPDALFTTLHERFNTRNPPIQGPEAFLFDVRECARESDDVDTFYAKLSERRDQRVVELNRAWENISYLMGRELSTSVFGCLDCKSMKAEKTPREMMNDPNSNRLGAFRTLRSTMSYDALVEFFDGFVRERREIEDEKRRKSKANLERLFSRRKLDHNTTSIGDRDQSASGDPAIGAPAGPAPNSSDTGVPEPPISPRPTPSEEADAAGPAPDTPNIDASELPVSPDSVPSDETNTIRNHLAQDAPNAIRPNTETKPVKKHPSPPSDSLSPLRESSATQKDTAGEDPQASSTPSGARKRSRSSLGPGQGEEGDMGPGHASTCKKRRMSHSNSHHHSNPPPKQTVTRQTPSSPPASTTARCPPDKTSEETC